MDAASVSLIIGIIAQGVGVASEISALAKRVQAGEIITDAEILAAQQAVEAACQKWDEAGAPIAS